MGSTKEYNAEYYRTHKEKMLNDCKIYYQKHREAIIKHNTAYSKIWSRNNPAKRRSFERKYRYTHPWVKTYIRIINRCNSNPFYLAKGIRYHITVTELKKLWLRDQAHLLKFPTIDRKDSSGDYTFDNCQYIELKDNLKKRVWRKASVSGKPDNTGR